MKKIALFIGILLTCLIQSIDAQTVYITDTGAKYHSENCRFLNKSKISIDLSDAKNKGYEACKICNPSQTINTTNKTETIDNSVLHNVLPVQRQVADVNEQLQVAMVNAGNMGEIKKR